MSINVKYGSFSFSGIGNEPTVTFDTEINRSSAGYIIGVIDKITLNGVIYSTGSLNNNLNYATNDGAWKNLSSGIRILQTGLKDYNKLSILCGSNAIYESDENTTIINSINFNNSTDDNWTQIIDYTISLSVPNTGYINYIPDTGYYVSNFEDNYSIQTEGNENYYYSNSYANNRYFNSIQTQHLPKYTITRTISAEGLATKNKSSLDNAKSFVSGLLNNNPRINSIISNLTILDRSINITSNVIEGKYSITDNFIAMSGNNTSGWTDSFTVNNEVDSNLVRSVSIQGTIQGFNNVTGLPEIYNNLLTNTNLPPSLTGTKFINASGGFYNHVKDKVFARALQAVYTTGTFASLSNNYSLNTGLNPIPISVNVENNIVEGTVTYSYSYNSRPLSLISGAISETINMEDTLSNRTYVMQDVFRRMPLAQDMGTRSLPTRTITYDATFPRPLTNLLPSTVKTAITGILDNFNPNKLTPLSSNLNTGPGYYSWLVADEESYDIIAGKYTKKYSWQYAKGYFPQGFYIS